MRWWGWGDPGHPPGLPAHALGFLTEVAGIEPRPCPPVALGDIHLDPSSLDQGTLAALSEIVGAEGVLSEHSERVLHAGGKGYADLVRVRSGELEAAPDAIVLPTGRDQVRAILEICSRRSLAVVPFGGGTSVVGGVAPLRGSHAAVIALDLRRMAEMTGLDRESMTVTVEAGMRGPALEGLLAERRLTLGHFPQSFEYVSLGGCAATRSAGQASTGYGGIERMVRGLRFTAPAGDIDLPALPASAAGPDLREVLIGSEGVLGVICELDLRVREAPARLLYEGVFFSDFAAGVDVLRALAQGPGGADVARLSDEQETRMSLALAGSETVKQRLGQAYLGLRGFRDRGCLAILGFEGAERDVTRRRRHAIALARRAGGLPVGRSAGEAWAKGRYAAPYLRDELLDQGVMVETLETATQWSNLLRLHAAVLEAIDGALAECGTPGLVMCHVSHLYETGASLYFTFIASQQQGRELAQWQSVKGAASRAIIDDGGTITHHHAVGRDHRDWMLDEVGREGLAALAALKAEVDPAAIMNPGKLLP
jgi:alkyldihydroxyacetonephosphate synthase